MNVNNINKQLNNYLTENDLFSLSPNYINNLLVMVFVCLFVRLYSINVKTAEPIGPKFFMGPCVTPGKVYGD